MDHRSLSLTILPPGKASRFTYPPSPTSSQSRSPSPNRRPLPARLRALQAELAALESEVADPSNPALKVEGVDAGEMIRGLVDVRRRLEKVRMGREGRGRLVGVVLGDGGKGDSDDDEERNHDVSDKTESKREVVRSIAEMDKRVGELESLVGSASATLDEVCDLRNQDAVCSVQPKFPVHADLPTSSSYDHAPKLAVDAFDSTTAY